MNKSLHSFYLNQDWWMMWSLKNKFIWKNHPVLLRLDELRWSALTKWLLRLENRLKTKNFACKKKIKNAIKFSLYATKILSYEKKGFCTLKPPMANRYQQKKKNCRKN